MTSLTGFEALLLGKKVVTYGNPFYAGWGLTVDRSLTCIGRQHALTIEGLIAATLICYPTYVSMTTGRFTTAERVLEELRHMRAGSYPSINGSLVLGSVVKARQVWAKFRCGAK
jgi:capsular polysaccharide export protein